MTSPFSLSTALRVIAGVAVGTILLAGCSSSSEGGFIIKDTNTQGGDSQGAVGGKEGDSEGDGNGNGNSKKAAESLAVDPSSAFVSEISEEDYPSKSDLAEDIDKAKNMSVNNIKEYNDDIFDELNERFDEATSSESKVLGEEMRVITKRLEEQTNSLNAERKQEELDMGDSVSSDETGALSQKYEDKYAEIDSQYSDEINSLLEDFNKDIGSQRDEFYPDYAEAVARYEYMLEVKE